MKTANKQNGILKTLLSVFSMKTFHSTTDGEHYAIPITKAKQRET